MNSDQNIWESDVFVQKKIETSKTKHCFVGRLTVFFKKFSTKSYLLWDNFEYLYNGCMYVHVSDVLHTYTQTYVHRNINIIHKDERMTENAREWTLVNTYMCMCNVHISKHTYTYVNSNMNTIHKEEQMSENENVRNIQNINSFLFVVLFLPFLFSHIRSSLWIVFMLMCTYVCICFEIGVSHTHTYADIN